MDKDISGGGGGDGAGGGGGGRGGGSCPSLSSLRLTSDIFGWQNGVRKSGPPAFLTKTYTIVDDPNTNSIISWGKFGNSFIIWDHIKFSAEILPKYFRHSNLSSFVYQLNNYGFRKIGTDHQWEYENLNFQAGKVHLLKNMKRRGQNPDNVPRRRGKRNLCHRPEIQIMNETKLEIKKLKSQQSNMEFHIMALEEEVKNVENNAKKLTVYWAKACEIIAQKMREETEKENSDDEARKKRKLDTPDHRSSIEEHCEVNETNRNLDEMNADYEAALEKNSADYAFWKAILLEDDEVYEDEGRGEMENKQAEIALDLEDLIMKLDDQDSG